ncbi:hypothetical protein EV126DRAFT_28020 [Verticillium dahliae]|nr:hypothetical protein EV126DRAFT_28020 [Verticillium dahliae]
MTGRERRGDTRRRPLRYQLPYIYINYFLVFFFWPTVWMVGGFRVDDWTGPLQRDQTDLFWIMRDGIALGFFVSLSSRAL